MGDGAKQATEGFQGAAQQGLCRHQVAFREVNRAGALLHQGGQALPEAGDDRELEVAGQAFGDDNYRFLVVEGPRHDRFQ